MRLFVLLIALGALTGCSHDFWYRSPRVAGEVQAPCPPECPPACPPACPEPTPCPTACPPPGPTGVPRSTPPAVRNPTAAVARAGGRPTCDEQAVFDEVNRIRCSMGLRPFCFNPVLHGIAEAHSREQCTYGFMGHSSPDPRRETLLQRMKLGGYDGSVFGEVVAWGYRTPQAVVEGWMNSPNHRAILVDRDMQESAFSRIGDYWTGNFGTPMTRRPALTAPPQGYIPQAAPPRVMAQPRVTVQPRYAPAPPSQILAAPSRPQPQPQRRAWRPVLRGG